jgi:hypothetical protein
MEVDSRICTTPVHGGQPHNYIAAGVIDPLQNCPEAAACAAVQALPRCCNSCMVGCQRVTTGNVRPPQPYVSIRVGRQRKA